MLLAKSLHYGLFSHLAQSTPGSIWTPLRQSVYYSGPIWCSQQKNVIALPCLRLPCIVTRRSTAGHYNIQQILCDTTLEGVMSPERRFHQESPCRIISDHLATWESLEEGFFSTVRGRDILFLQWEQIQQQLNYIKKSVHWEWKGKAYCFFLNSFSSCLEFRERYFIVKHFYM